jgi:hypothetical protein
MKLSELLESDDDNLRKFHKSLGDEIRAGAAARKATHDAMFKDHKWRYDEGDMIMSNKTGKVYKITARISQYYTPRDEKFKPTGPKQLVPAYRYKAGEEEGTLLEPKITDGMFTLMTKGKNVKTSPDED